jgi:hypothetical protein
VPFVTGLLFVAAQTVGSAVSPSAGLPFAGEAALDFLSTAEVVSIEYFTNSAGTKPRKVTLSDNGQVHFAVFKTVDDVPDVIERASTRALQKTHDSYKHEIAAWELSRLLGLSVIPPCVERELERETGSLCLWVEGAATARQLQKANLFHPPEPQLVDDQLDDIRLFLQLVWDAEYSHASNILIDPAWNLYKIDSSRSFKTDHKLRRSGSLTRFRQSTIEALEALTREEVDERLGPWLDEDKIDSLWKRRAKILNQAEAAVAEHGAEAVLY